MKKRVLLSSAALSLLSCILAYTMLSDSDVYAQERERVSGPLVKQTASVRKVERSTSAFINAAAAENAGLRSSLSWTFSGKTQRGWNIYVPLISQAIGVDAGPDTPEFALALSVWQGNAGLLETGVLDEATMESFRTYWQSRRLGRFERSADDALLSAPIVEFFDPTRSTDMLQLERETYAAYKKMVAAASKDLGHELRLTKDGELAPEEKFLRIVSGYRSPEYQDALRRKEPNAGRGTLAKNSPHSTGHAIDIYVGGEP
ncbi:MAG: hypothetical protein ABIO91_07435, partial [Pyrinomonadaceae bacterium]